MGTLVQKIKENKQVDFSSYVNSDTGEEFLSELKGNNIKVSSDSEFALLDSDNYTIIDADALNYLRKFLNRSEIGSIGIMASDLKTPWNLVFNNTVPHTNETLQEILGIASNSTFTLLIKKLMKLGVLYQIKGQIMGKVRVIYMMNPFVARKRKQFADRVINIFEEFKLLNQ